MDYRAARRRMVDDLVSRGDASRGPVADALRAVPRHEFVPEPRRDSAYADRPLPIGEGQTISAPHMVGRMVELLEVGPGDRVLEIGTGCGYHAAVTAEIVGDGNVYSVEFEERLGREARARLDRLGYGVHVHVGDGREGWPEHAPYDAAYLTCAPSDIPDPVVEQTRPGGTVVGPVGTLEQHLVRLTPQENGDPEKEYLSRVRFVPMQG